MKRILIDGRFIGVGDSIGRYVLELLREILKIDQENQYTLLIRPEGRKAIFDHFSNAEILNDQLMKNGKCEMKNSKSANLQIQVLDIPHYTFAEQTQLLKYLNEKQFDLVHFSQFNHPIRYKGRFVTTIHDLILLEKLSVRNLPKQLAFRKAMADAVCRSKKVIAISEYVKRAIVDNFDVFADKIRVIYHGMDHTMFNLESKAKSQKLKDFKEANKIEGDYLLYTGAWKKHKNLKRLFEAFEEVKSRKLKAESIQLVLVGKIDHNEPGILAEIDRINNEAMKQFRNVAIIPVGAKYGEELAIAYAGALVYVIPSLAEGFGWPPLEAMACGTPVVASNASVIPEILGDAAHYFDPLNTEDIAKAIEKIVTDKSLYQELIQRGLARADRYHWEKAAVETLSIYRESLG